MSGDDELGDMIAELTRLRDKVIEVACLKHIVDKGDAGSEEAEQFDDSFSELEQLANGNNPLPNLFPVDELRELKGKVREFVAVNEKLHNYLDAPAITYEEYCALGDRSEALYQEFKELVK